MSPMFRAGFLARNSAVRHLSVIVLALLATALAETARADGPDEAIPSFYQEAGVSSRRDQSMTHPVERVDPFTGKLQWHFTDVVVPGNGGLDLRVQRSYSSLNEGLVEESPFGAGWTLHFGRILRKANVSPCVLGQGPGAVPVMELSDGSRHMLYDNLDSTGFMSVGMWKATCNTGPEGGFVVQSPDGTTYEMFTPGAQVGVDINKKQSAWYTKRIVDRNGNWLAFTYVYLGGGTSFGVQAVTSSDGRSVTFTYDANVLQRVNSGSYQWSYTVEPIGVVGNHNHLREVIRPDNGRWIYDYNPSGSGPGLGTPGGYSMRTATYPTGAVVNYSYAFKSFSANPFLPVSTVISQKTSSDGLWTYDYVPATAPLVFSGGETSWMIDPGSPTPTLDHTTVTGPDGVEMYFHVGYTSVDSGSVYLIGAQAGKAVKTKVEGLEFWSQIDANGWDWMPISNMQNLRPGSPISDFQILRPLLWHKKVARAGVVYETTYDNFDTYGNPQTITETGTDTRTTTVSYFTNPAKWILGIRKDESTNTIGNIARNFDSNGNLLNETRYGVTTSFTYSGGDLSSRTNARGYTSTFGGYVRGIPQSESHPENANISRTVDSDGNVTSETDGVYATTGYTYDGLRRITGITRAAGNGVTVAWTLVSRTVTRGSYREVTTYDTFGRQVQIVNTDTGTNESITRTFRYNSLGQRTFASYPGSTKGTQTVQDILGQPLVVRHEYQPDTGAYVGGRTFEDTGDMLTLTNERGLAYKYHYRSYGDPGDRHLMQIETPIVASNITMARNGLGQLTSATQDGLTRSYVYNAKYFLESTTEPEVGQTRFGRDALGNMEWKEVGSAPRITYTYDGRDRLTTTSLPAENIVRSYYADDKLQMTSTQWVQRQYTYDANKNLTNETLYAYDISRFVQVGYHYNANDALEWIEYGSGKRVQYKPDGFGRATMAAPYVREVTHHPGGQLKSIKYMNGIETEFTLNNRQWPETMKVTGNAGPIFNTSYGYDGIGNVYSILDTVDATYNRGMEYDGLDRLTTANGAWGFGQYNYDARGNISSYQLGLTGQPGAYGLTYYYDAVSNRLNSTSGTKPYSFTYDAYGNVSANGYNSFQYNDVQAMKCSDCGLPTEVTYGYDASNIRVHSRKNGVATFFVYGMGGNLLWEQTGQDVTEYIYVDGKQVATRKKAGN